eukprot:COSAG06_NODE_87_length_24962_cov_107.553795_16_plen_76_part_00
MRSDLGFVWVSRARIRKKRLYTYPHSLQYRMAIAAVEMLINAAGRDSRPINSASGVCLPFFTSRSRLQPRPCPCP